MDGTPGTRGRSPGKPGKPGEQSTGLAADHASRGLAKATQFEDQPGRIEEGMGMRTVDGNPLVITGNPIPAGTTEQAGRVAGFLIIDSDRIFFPAIPPPFMETDQPHLSISREYRLNTHRISHAQVNRLKRYRPSAA